MVVVLRDDVPEKEVTRIEGDVARYFGVSTLSLATPRRR
jgi:hypothetical protein